MKLSKIYIVFFLAIVSCIDPFRVRNLEPEGLLAIEAFLTSDAKIQHIRLSRAGPYGPDIIGRNIPLRGAEVQVKDDLGNIERFLEGQEAGVYLSSPN